MEGLSWVVPRETEALLRFDLSNLPAVAAISAVPASSAAAPLAAATAAATATIARATATAAAALGLRPRFVDHQIASTKILAIHGINRAVRFFVVVDFHEGKTA